MDPTLFNDISEFFENKLKNPDKYVILDDGTYAVLNTSGKVAERIYTPPEYRQPTAEEIQLDEQKHRENVKIYENELSQAIHELYKYISDNEHYNTVDDKESLINYNKKLYKLNNTVSVANNKLFKANHVLHDLIHYPSVPKNQILFDEFPYDVRVIRDVNALSVRSLTLEQQYSRIANPSNNINLELNDNINKTATSHEIVIFHNPNDPDTGYLCLKFPIDIVYNDKSFKNAWDAVYYNVAIDVGDNKMRDRIGRDSSRKDQYNKVSETGIPEKSSSKDSDKWKESLTKHLYNVNLKKFSENSALNDKLIKTADFKLVSAEDPTNFLTSAGLGAGDNDILDPRKWKGDNLYGVVLERVRTTIRKTNTVLNNNVDIPLDNEVDTDVGAGAGAGIGVGTGAGIANTGANNNVVDLEMGGGGGNTDMITLNVYDQTDAISDFNSEPESEFESESKFRSESTELISESEYNPDFDSNTDSEYQSFDKIDLNAE